MKPAPRVFAVGERITVQGYHKNWTPVIVEIEGTMAKIKTPELPGAEEHWVRLTRLEKIKE